jgi:hypothetical protein
MQTVAVATPTFEATHNGDCAAFQRGWCGIAQNLSEIYSAIWLEEGWLSLKEPLLSRAPPDFFSYSFHAEAGASFFWP